jgi:ADP-ribose pyrophosphatase YjhB (NUDIX family)
MDLHTIQLKILTGLLFQPHARFRDLEIPHITSDHLTYHLKTLIKLKLIQKKDSKYSLTKKGKELAGRIDTDTALLEKQPKVGVAVLAVRIYKGRKQILIHKRLKQPFYGFEGGVTGKIKYSEKIEETAARELFEETGVSGEVTCKGIIHYRDFDEKQSLLSAKILFVFIVENLKGNLKKQVKEGKNFWIDYSKLHTLKQPFPGFIENVCSRVNSPKLIFMEEDREIKQF